jgi:hypothetical protein
MDQLMIDLRVAQFAAEMEIYDSDDCDRAVNTWYVLEVHGYTAQELLESMHRHVTVLDRVSKDSTLFEVHLEMLLVVTEEIERRRQALEDDTST